MNHLVQYHDGVISKGEQELLINTEARNEANRRVVLKGYIVSPDSSSEIDENCVLDFGYFRMAMEGYASAFVGANVVLSGSVNVSCDPEGLLLKGVMTDEDKKTTEEKKEQSDRETFQAEAEGKGEAFAGVKAEAGLKSFLQWNPEMIQGSDCKELGNVGVAVNGSAGIGFEGEFKIGYDKESGRFTVKAKASVTLGILGGGTVDFSVGLGGLLELLKYVYQQIRDNDFSFVDFFEKSDDVDTYMIFVMWHVKMLQNGIDLAKKAEDEVKDAILIARIKAQEILSNWQNLIDIWGDPYQSNEEVHLLLESLENGNGTIQYLTPEVKGRLLFFLAQHRIGNLVDDLTNLDLNHRSEWAALQIIKECIVSKRDWQETFEHIVINANANKKQARPAKKINEKVENKSKSQAEEDYTRMEENELWLKSYLLNDADDWAEVAKRKKELWENV